ncbi:MAG: metal-sensitive transcriptional regulator, partial [Cyanobacteria bacterium]|nr:metal-sensitive transcriptional regulator [Cyanobacteriota bacterium]
HRMVDEQKYCIDVLHQLKAVQAALDKVGEEILKQHLETCVVEAIKNQDEKRVLEELVQVFRKSSTLYVNEDLPQGVSETHEVQSSKVPSTSVASSSGGCCF